MTDTEGVSRRAVPNGAYTTGTAPTDVGGAAPLPFQPGETIGRYQVRNVLGAGGMGLVFTAFDPELGRNVALKLIRPDGKAPSARARTRLLREAQTLGKLQHPNVVTIYDVGTDGEQVFLAMELVSGPTLSAWLARARRSWRAIRDVFLAAGRGLAAAHAVGIIHRDFKPSNVIVGADRVVVVDFGVALARGAEPSDGESDPSSAGSVLSLHLTLTGERVGTPRYMAPEQHKGEPVTALADQFSFANALWSAFYGTPAFSGETPEALLREIARGPAAPPSGSKVPERVRTALARALALRPGDRWPALVDLLAALTHDPVAVRRRRIAFAVAAGAILAVGATAFGIGRSVSAPDPCAGADAMVASLWDDATRTKTEEAFRRTGRPYADGTFLRVDASLRQRIGDWARAHRDACEATTLRHAQPSELLDARMVCLRRARTEIAALVSLLGDADAASLDRATSAAGKVGDVSACDNLAALRDAVPPPTDPDQAREVDDLRGDVAHLEALRLLGKIQEGLAAGRQVIGRARTVGYSPLLAAALDKTAWFEVTAGHDDAAIDLGYETARVGAEAHDDSLVASGMMGVAYALGFDKQRFESAEVAFQSAAAAAARAGNPGVLLERLYGDREAVLYQHGDYLVVLPLCQVVYALSVRLHGADSYQAALSLSELGDAMGVIGHPGEAADIFQRALASAEMALGPEHPIVLAILGNAGRNRLDAFDFDGAAPYFQREVLGQEKLFGPDDPGLAIVVHNLGMVRRGQRRLPEARALLERAIGIRLDKLGPDHPLVASNSVELAEVARLEGRPDEALADFDRAIAIDRGGESTPHLSLVRRYRAKADLLVGLGRLNEARATLALAQDAFVKAGTDPTESAFLLEVSADLLRASGRPREALPVYQKALPGLETLYGRNGPGLIDVLLGLGEAELEAGDTTSALATAERAVAIGINNSIPPDQLGAAQFLLARVRWARDEDRPAALALVRGTRARLAALPYPADALPRIDRWLAQVSR